MFFLSQVVGPTLDVRKSASSFLDVTHVLMMRRGVVVFCYCCTTAGMIRDFCRVWGTGNGEKKRKGGKGDRVG